MSALEVAKICDNPLVETLILDIRRTVNKSQGFLDKTKAIVMRKNGLSEEMDVSFKISFYKKLFAFFLAVNLVIYLLYG